MPMNFCCVIIKQIVYCNPLIITQQLTRFYVEIMFITTSLIRMKILKCMKHKVTNKSL